VPGLNNVQGKVRIFGIDDGASRFKARSLEEAQARWEEESPNTWPIPLGGFGSEGEEYWPKEDWPEPQPGHQQNRAYPERARTKSVGEKLAAFYDARGRLAPIEEVLRIIKEDWQAAGINFAGIDVPPSGDAHAMTTPPDPAAVRHPAADLITARLKKLRLTLTRAAEIAEVSRDTFYRAMKGKPLSEISIIRIERALKCRGQLAPLLPETVPLERRKEICRTAGLASDRSKKKSGRRPPK